MSKPFIVPASRADHRAVRGPVSAAGVSAGKGATRGGQRPGRPRDGQGATAIVGVDPTAGGAAPVARPASSPTKRSDDTGAALLKMIGSCLLATACVWGLVLGGWQSYHHHPTALDLVLHLGALPLALIGGYFALRGLLDHRPAFLPAGASLLDEDQRVMHCRQAAAAGRELSLCLLDACMLTPGGGSAAALLSAIAAGQRPRPSAHLVDDEGAPLVAAEVDGLDVDAVTARLQLGLPAQEPWLASDEMLRSLALLDAVLREAIPRVAGLLDTPGPLLRCICLLPAHWETAHFPWLHSWLQRTHFAAFAPGRCELSLVRVADDSAALRHVDELCVALNREPEGERLVLLASAVSALDRRVVADWAARERLFPACHRQRRVPGECAVALLLASPAQALRLPIDTDAVVQLGRLAVGQAVAAAGRGCGRPIGQLIGDVLADWRLDGAQLKALVSDGDHRGGHPVEALDGLAAAGAQLDPLTDCLVTGTVVGSAAPAGGLVALACAASRALADRGPVLCLGNQYESLRAAVLVRPLAAPPPGQPSRT